MNSAFLAQFGQTITALIAFVIFFMILKKFAWGPILQTLDERQKKIQDGFDEVKKLQEDAKEAHARYEEKLRSIEEEARVKIQEAVDQGRRVAEEITAKAQADSAEIVDKARRNMEIELAGARKKLREDIVNLTISATERLIRERLDADRDRKLVDAFISELEGNRSR